MKSPVNRAAMKLATPVVPKRPAVCGRQHARFDQARRDIGGKQEVVELEEHAKAEQHDHGPDRARRRQPVDARRDRAGGQGRCAAVVHVSSPCRRLRACLALLVRHIRRALAAACQMPIAAALLMVRRSGARRGLKSDLLAFRTKRAQEIEEARATADGVVRRLKRSLRLPCDSVIRDSLQICKLRETIAKCVELRLVSREPGKFAPYTNGVLATLFARANTNACAAWKAAR